MMDKMEVANRWGWLPREMPSVSKMVASERKQLGDDHVNECWRRGMAGEPGWFFAREGVIAIGTPWALDDPGVASFAALQLEGAAMVMLRPKGGA